MPPEPFHEAKLGRTPIRELGLKIEDTWLEPIIGELRGELAAAGIRKLRPRFYLSTEWGVPSGTIAIAIPFYLVRPELTALHAERTGHVEGFSKSELLRYLRHELGHAVSYAYHIYEEPEFIQLFGSITQPYIEEYRPEPFSRRFVSHLPGWYAQKHPDEDWAETFAVWLTPRRDWRAEYADWPEALAKLEYVDRTIKRVGDQDPLLTADDLDEDVGEIQESLDEFYAGEAGGGVEYRGLDGALRSIFDDPDGGGRPASELVRRAELDLVANVYRFTGHFPEQTRPLVHHLARRADELGLSCGAEGQLTATIALTALVAALAMNFVYRGRYFP